VLGSPQRLLAVDTRGVTRVWNIEHPAFVEQLHGIEGSIPGASGRWLVTSQRRRGAELWHPSVTDDRSIRLPGSADPDTIHAVDPQARWVLSFRVETPVRETATPAATLLLELWDLERAAPQNHPPAEWRVTVPEARPGQNWWVRASRGEAVWALALQSSKSLDLSTACFG
jgi:hypothetical protein